MTNGHRFERGFRVGHLSVRSSRWTQSALAALTAGLVSLPAGLAGASTQPTNLLSHPPGTFQVRPARVVGPGGLTWGTHGILGGPRRPGHRLGHIHWRSWSTKTASGTGIAWQKRHGRWVNVGAVKITVSFPGAHGFTQLTESEGSCWRGFGLKYDRGHHEWSWSQTSTGCADY